MSNTVAQVLIASQAQQLDKLFDYDIPIALREEIAVGARVLVPFQNRPNLGYIWNLSDHSAFAKLKSLQQLIDSPPLLNQVQLQLVEWLADYYLCSRVEVLRLCFPPGSKLNREGQYSLGVTPEILKISLTTNLLASQVEPANSLILSGIRSHWPQAEWRRKLEVFPEILEWLIKEKILITSYGISKAKVKAKTNKLYTWMTDRRPDTTAANRIFEVLTENPTGLSNAELCTTAQVGTSVVKRLLNQGVLACNEVTVTREPEGFHSQPIKRKVELNQEQQQAYQQVSAAADGSIFLLHGVTGSGKTELYLELAAQVMGQGKQVLYLVPEIALTPQTLERARNRFGEEVALLHSNMSDGERFDQWFRIKEGKAKIVVGARSALFAPMERLGLIIVDEEHESSYKQEETPRYHVRKVVEQIAQLTGAKVVLGSATPSLESYYYTENGKYRYLSLRERFNKNPLPAVTVINMREELAIGNKHILSRELQAAITTSLSAREQVILLLNRRGYATFILCRDCGHTLKCPNCEIALTYHQTETVLRCHYCDFRQSVPQLCPECQSNRIRYFGQGTQKLEEELTTNYPGVRLARMDQDSTARKGAHYRIYQQLVQGEVDILLGTQMVAKGLDLPRVSLVGVIAADASLNIPDFRAAERGFQLLTQVAGRTGRGSKCGRVIFQAYNPEHYSLQLAKDHDYLGFYQVEVAYRRELNYPPFAEIIKINLSGLQPNKVAAAATDFVKLLKAASASNVSSENQDWIEILGPAPALIPKIQNKYRWQILIKSQQTKVLTALVNQAWLEFQTLKFNDIKVVRDRNPYSVI